MNSDPRVTLYDNDIIKRIPYESANNFCDSTLCSPWRNHRGVTLPRKKSMASLAVTTALSPEWLKARLRVRRSGRMLEKRLRLALVPMQRWEARCQPVVATHNTLRSQWPDTSNPWRNPKSSLCMG